MEKWSQRVQKNIKNNTLASRLAAGLKMLTPCAWMNSELGVLCNHLSSTSFNDLWLMHRGKLKTPLCTHNSWHTCSIIAASGSQISLPPPKLITNDTQVLSTLKILLITVVRQILRLDYNSWREIFRFRLSKQGYTVHVGGARPHSFSFKGSAKSFPPTLER